MKTERDRDWLSGIVDRAENWGPIAAAGYYLVLAAFGLAAFFILAAIFGWVEQRVTVDVGGLIGGVLAFIAAMLVIAREKPKGGRRGLGRRRFCWFASLVRRSVVDSRDRLFFLSRIGEIPRDENF